MPWLRIPKEYERGILAITNLPDDEAKNVLKVLNEISPASRANDIALALGKVLTGLTNEDIESVVETILSLYRLRSFAEDVSVDDFVDDLAAGIQDIQPKPGELANIKGRFKALLTVQSILMRTKVRGLRTDFANIFYDAKIISDIRPVWDGDVKQPPEGVVLTHTLKLEYHHVGGHGEIYICLSANDIEVLASVLQRAQDKTRTLTSSPPSSWLKFLDS